MKNLLPLFVLALTLVFTSCEKEEGPQLPENPYNYIGQQHNDLMTKFKTENGAEFDQIDSPFEAEFFIIDKMYEDRQVGIVDFRNAKEQLNISSDMPISGYDFMNASTLCDVLQLPPAIQDIICPTTATLLSIDGTTEAGNAEIHRVIREAEEKLIQEHQFDEGNGYSTAMAFLAVAKYSSDLNQGSTRAKWWQVVLADAVGAGLGILAGGGTAVPLAAGFSAAVLKV